jgi:hypothetical protein
VGRKIKRRGLVECAACGERVAKLRAHPVHGIKFGRHKIRPHVCDVCWKMTEAQHRAAMTEE